MSFEIKGLVELQRRLERIARETPEVLGRALYQEALIEQKESMQRTPVEFGALKASHVTRPPEIRGNDISVAIEVGGPAAPYAIYVHENLDANHKVGRAKFLESTIMESRPFLAARVAKRIDVARLVR